MKLGGGGCAGEGAYKIRMNPNSLAVDHSKTVFSVFLLHFLSVPFVFDVALCFVVIQPLFRPL